MIFKIERKDIYKILDQDQGLKGIRVTFSNITYLFSQLQKLLVILQQTNTLLSTLNISFLLCL